MIHEGAFGWLGRHHRVEGDVWWVQGDMDRAAAAYEAARSEVEEHGVADERAHRQAEHAFVLAFTDPALADDELDLAQQLLAELDVQATAFTTRISTLVRDADANVDDWARALRTDIHTTGLEYAELTQDLALAFHHTVCGARCSS
ncbi:hypothetical protein [Streptomyces sp. R35]|uniref:Tetratricopeptide repeat protein n=1 Tax=Streptomyces sp. R35 TaxID=3238630 RepID=A0AB39SMQ3_9ACTN